MNQLPDANRSGERPISISSAQTEWVKEADRLILWCAGIYVALALGLGIAYGQFAVAALIALPALGVCWGAYSAFGGTRVTRIVFPVVLMGLVALHIQLGAGRIEYHFGVFVTLGLLLSYRDALPILAGASVIALHHLAFDRLQSLGLPVYCTTQPGLGTVMLHAGYVVAQSGMELVLVARMRAAAMETEAPKPSAVSNHEYSFCCGQ
jgi:methyl-accepting chemotaxis protein